ncbi:MAG: alcohol dehydrogenase catalytic domain-containing protein [Rectinemataceae bacterium]|jgi:L-iditol 2-dehydrogenase
MKAARLFGVDDLRVVDVPLPEIGSGEVLLRVRAALICGTDIRMLKNGAKSSPLTLGHEIAGMIEKVGRDVRGYRPGMRVAVAPNYGCGVCDQCVSGQGQNCASLRALGIHDDGGFAEYVRIPALAVAQGNISPIEDDLSFSEAAIAEPLSCVYNSFERARFKPGESVIVIGAGPIGLLHAKLYKLAGAGLVMMSDVNADRLAACVKDEPSFVAVPAEGAKERVMELTRGAGADVVITAASVAAVQQLAFGLAALNGRVIFFGGLPAGKEIVGLDTNVIHYRMITVTGTSRQSLAQYRACLGLIGRGLIDVRSVITRTWPLDGAAEAFASALRGEGLKSGFVME